MSKSKKIESFLPYPLLTGGLIIGLIAIAYLLLKVSLPVGLLASIFPIVISVLLLLLKYPPLVLTGVFVANYFIMGLTRYIPNLQGGIIIDALLLLTIIISLIRTVDGTIIWRRAGNSFVVMGFIWLIYCIALLINPYGSIGRWSIGIRGVGLYLFLFPLLTAVIFSEFKYLKLFLIVWSGLTITAVLKTLFQKYIGFDSSEKYWLYVLGGARTHIIYSGVRYFSFFTDAASFGCSMALSMVVFLIYSFYVGSKALRIYLLFVSLASGYGMILSGTRAAMAIPFTGFVFFVILSKQWKIVFTGSIMLVLTFLFFNFTNIGQGNAEIRRMRSAFHMEKDASFKVRLENQEKMKAIMKDKPFGIGIGNAKQNVEGEYMYKLPTDSSLVFVWIETGVVGLILFLGIFLVTLLRGSLDVLFRIKDKELKGVLCALLAGITGVLVSSYGNEFLHQFPNGPIIYTCMTFVFMGRKLDKDLYHE